VIVNPEAGRGRGRRLLDQVRHAFEGSARFRLRETRFQGDEEAIARAEIADGCEIIVAVGGDGTCARVANAIINSGGVCRLAVLPAGTGNDFAKMLGVSRFTPLQIAEVIAGDTATRIDVGFANEYYFLNSCGFGFDASVLEASKSVRFLKGNAVYIYSALTNLFSYRGIEISADGVPGTKGRLMLMVTVSNGRFLGGAFKIAPHASVLDGKLDACFFSDSNVVGRVRLFVGAMRGTHIGMPSVSTASVQHLALTFPTSPVMEMDGELRVARSRTVELTCVPRALAVVAAPGAIV
jgi:YegS/Rv2252/BmrU family lipid kinase